MQTRDNRMTIKQALLAIADRLDPKDPEMAKKLRKLSENPAECDAEQFIRTYLKLKNSPLDLFSFML